MQHPISIPPATHEPAGAAPDAPRRRKRGGRWPGRRLRPRGAWLSPRFARTWRRGGLALLLLCLVVYVPGLLTLPPIDRDESRFAQASRQMAQSGTREGWAVPRIQDRPRLSKPPLIYWAQAAAVRALGDRGRTFEGIWVYRLPSLLAAVATVLLTWRFGLALFDPRPAWLAAATLAVAPVFAWEAHQARADHLLVLTVVATQFALWRAWHGHPARVSPPLCLRASVPLCLLFWLPLSAGILTKGPITPMIAALTALTLSLTTRQFRWLLRLRPLLGLAILLAIITPWLYTVGQSVGWHAYLTTVYDETIGRATAAKEGHWAPPGYHLILLPVLFWPGSLLTAAAIFSAIRMASRVARRSAAGSSPSPTPPQLFLLAWIIPSWLIFELSFTKLPHYTMPLYPAIALLSARYLYHLAARPSPRPAAGRLGTAAWLAIGAALNVALPVAAATLLTHDTPFRILPRMAVETAKLIGRNLRRADAAGHATADFIAAAAPAIGIAAALAAAVLLLIAARTRLVVRTQVCGVLAAALALPTLFGLLLPTSSAIWLSPRLADHLGRSAPAAPIALVGYHEDSMLFLTRGRAVRLAEADLPAWLDDHPDGLAVVPIDAMPRHPRLLEIHRERGFNYSTGRWMDLIIAERAGSTEPSP